MRGRFRRVIVFLMILVFGLSGSSVCFASNTESSGSSSSVSMTEVAKYALQFDGTGDGKVKIPYCLGGSGRGKTLEELVEKFKDRTTNADKSKGNSGGTDCSGFTQSVYAHFGISIPSVSHSQKSAAKQTWKNDNSHAVPGDIVYWPHGHVALYIGDNKIIHTSSFKSADSWYPHISDLSTYGTDEDRYFCRMVDDVSELKPISGTEAKEEEEKVKTAELGTSLILESDITGMPSESSLRAEQKRLEAIGIDSLSQEERVSLAKIQDDLSVNRLNAYDVVRMFFVVVGIGFMLYGVLMLVAYMWDYSNNLFDISFLSLISFGRFKVFDEDLPELVKGKKNVVDGVVYLTKNMLYARIAVMELIGLFLVSGIAFRWMVRIFYLISTR